MPWVFIITITIIGVLLWWGLSRAQQTFRSYVIKPTHYVIKPIHREIIVEFSEEISSIESDTATEKYLPEPEPKPKPEPEPEITLQQYLDEIKQMETQYQEEILNGLTNNLSLVITKLANIQIQMQDLQALCAIQDDYQQIELSYQQSQSE